MNNNEKWIIAGVVGVVVLCLCLGISCIGLGGLAWFGIERTVSQITPGAFITQVATLEGFPGFDLSTPEPTARPMEDQAPASEGALETLNTLENEIVPINDPRELARRLEGKTQIPETMTPAGAPIKVGDSQIFWATNVETNENFQVKATLRHATDHLYFWVEDGVSYDQDDMRRLAEAFEEKIYPTNRAFFGSEWSPGIDGDPHLYVLYARGLGSGIAGYFSSADELPPQAHQYSNAHEMFMISADNVELGEDYIYGTMAHEFQHMIHWYTDRNEESWLNEGFSVLSELLNDYDTGGFDYLYASNPDMQLTYWPSPPDSTPHYGASFLFLAYFLDRFGDEATQALVGNEDNGMDSIDTVLTELNAKDPKTGKAILASDVFADWVIATYLNDERVEDGRFAYQRYENAPRTGATEEIGNCSPDWQTRTVHQFGVDYVEIACSGSYTLNFEGATEVGVLPADAHSGDYAFWSNKGDESNMTLTREFDFSQASGPLTLEYAAWYDLEEDYDYLYLDASTDGGATWQILETPSGRDKSEDPSGNAYGWGYNGQSGGWIEESVDISEFAGKKVLLRFEYVTDAAVNGEGLMVDDVRVPEIEYSADFETDEGGWQADGFVRIQNRLPQLFRVSLIEDGKTTTVKYIELDDAQSAQIDLEFGGGTDKAVLVVSGVTRFTTQKATYRFQFQP